MLNHFVYVQYGCGKQFEVAVSLNLDIITSFWLHKLKWVHYTSDTYCVISQMSTANEWGMTVSNMSVLMAYSYWRKMCSISSMLGHSNSKLVKNQQKTQNYTHLKHGCHVWYAQRAGYGQFLFQTFRISCGEWVEQVRSLRSSIGAIWSLSNLVLDPLTKMSQDDECYYVYWWQAK